MKNEFKEAFSDAGYNVFTEAAFKHFLEYILFTFFGVVLTLVTIWFLVDGWSSFNTLQATDEELSKSNSVYLMIKYGFPKIAIFTLLVGMIAFTVRVAKSAKQLYEQNSHRGRLFSAIKAFDQVIIEKGNIDLVVLEIFQKISDFGDPGLFNKDNETHYSAKAVMESIPMKSQKN